MTDLLPTYQLSPSQPAQITSGRLNICIVSDFFLPRLGGVELHQYCLAQALLNLGHKVIIVTGSYGPNNQRQGIRYLTGGLKVYYIPQIALHNQVSAPTLITLFPLFRQIALRESIDIIHGHQTTSPLAHQCIMYGKILNIPTLFTDHSMFGISTPSSIHVNKLGRFTMTGIDQVIAVSHTLRENIVIRSGISPHLISVVPNALDHTKFKPDPRCACVAAKGAKLPELLPQVDQIGNAKCCQCKLQRIPDFRTRPTFVILSRLVYRKGIEFVTFAIPAICKKYPDVQFVIGGGGPHLPRIRDMLQTEKLTERVNILGEIPHHRVKDVLQMGHIFINTSLTETFCIAILEAICTGLSIVATRVGGVPEVLPSALIKYCDPNHMDVFRAMEEALLDLLKNDPANFPNHAAPHSKPLQSPFQPPPHHPAEATRPAPQMPALRGLAPLDTTHSPPISDEDGAIDFFNANLTGYDPFRLHQITAPLYSWHNVAERTMYVYNYTIMQKYLQQEGLEFAEKLNNKAQKHAENGGIQNHDESLDDIDESESAQHRSRPKTNKTDKNDKNDKNDATLKKVTPNEDKNNTSPPSELIQLEFNHHLRQKHKYNHLWYLIRLYWSEHGFVSSFLFIFIILFTSFIDLCCDFVQPFDQIEAAQEFQRDGNSLNAKTPPSSQTSHQFNKAAYLFPILSTNPSEDALKNPEAHDDDELNGCGWCEICHVQNHNQTQQESAQSNKSATRNQGGAKANDEIVFDYFNNDDSDEVEPEPVSRRTRRSSSRKPNSTAPTPLKVDVDETSHGATRARSTSRSRKLTTTHTTNENKIPHNKAGTGKRETPNQTLCPNRAVPVLEQCRSNAGGAFDILLTRMQSDADGWG